MPLSFLVGIVRVMAPRIRCCDQGPVRRFSGGPVRLGGAEVTAMMRPAGPWRKADHDYACISPGSASGIKRRSASLHSQ